MLNRSAHIPHPNRRILRLRPWTACRERIQLLAILILFVVLHTQTGSNLTAAIESPTEAEIRAAILFNFMRFVEWPESGSPQLDETYATIAVIRAPQIASALRKAEGRTVGDRLLRIIEIKESTPPDQLRNYQMVYYGESAQMDPINFERERSPLTVGDHEAFLSKGGMIALVRDGARVRFDIRLDLVEANGIKIRAQMLRLARKVKEGA